jgi:hypothetical protein
VELTPIQRRILLRYRRFRDRPPTLGRILSPALPRLLILLGLILLSGYVLPTWATAFYSGVAVGGIAVQVALSVQACRVIPAFMEAMDWKKVDRLLGIDPDEEL